MKLDIASQFEQLCCSNIDKSEGVLAIQLLKELISKSDLSTVQGLNELLVNATNEMLSTEATNSSVKSACELFHRFITLTVLDNSDDFKNVKIVLLERADIFLKKVTNCREQIAKNSLSIIHDGANLLLHSKSRVVLTALEFAIKRGLRRNIHCYVAAADPGSSGSQMVKKLVNIGVKATLIPDTAIAYIMPRINAVLLGAESVVESGGILNRLGSCTIAMIANSLNKSVYVLVESFKFVRSYPLDQFHIPDEFKWRSKKTASSIVDKNMECNDDTVFDDYNSMWEKISCLRENVKNEEMPVVDYTSPKFITLLVTDLGVLTPSAVSDELIKLYL